MDTHEAQIESLKEQHAQHQEAMAKELDKLHDRQDTIKANLEQLEQRIDELEEGKKNVRPTAHNPHFPGRPPEEGEDKPRMPHTAADNLMATSTIESLLDYLARLEPRMSQETLQEINHALHSFNVAQMVEANREAGKTRVNPIPEDHYITIRRTNAGRPTVTLQFANEADRNHAYDLLNRAYDFNIQRHDWSDRLELTFSFWPQVKKTLCYHGFKKFASYKEE